MKNFNRILSVIFAAAVIFGCMADLKITASEPLPVVLEQNISVMTDIKDYGPDFVYDYIYPDGSDDDIIGVLEDIKSISDKVTQGIDDDYEKMRALDSYVSNLIAYDHDAAHNDVSFDTICLKNVLDRSRTTCAGFSNLYAALAQAQGLYCVNIRGSAPDAELGITRANLGDESTPINHEWTAVWYKAEQRWVYVDCTWNSLNTFENGEFSMNGAVTMYFDKPLDELSVNHKADSVVYRDFFGVNTEYFAGKVDFAQKPEETPVVTTTASTTVITQTTTTTSESGESTAETTAQTTTEKTQNNTAEHKSADADAEPSLFGTISIVFFVLAVLFAAGAVVFYFAGSKKTGKNKS